MINYILIIHLLAATIWTGGHLILALVVLPKVMTTRDIPTLMDFEGKFEKIGMPALIVQVITGFYMVFTMLPDISLWFSFDNSLSWLISAKISILTLTVLIALHARFRVIPNLSTKNLTFFALHIITVTLLAVSFVIIGTLFRTGF